MVGNGKPTCNRDEVTEVGDEFQKVIVLVGDILIPEKIQFSVKSLMGSLLDISGIIDQTGLQLDGRASYCLIVIDKSILHIFAVEGILLVIYISPRI